ncbi:reverse transcriptase domain-containing protein [Trichonephila clavipes]|nr:reverse transcriptase domain-containing protein [Trichonephila clavipes]
MELIHRAFEKHVATGILFLDIAKAFDKIWHEGLLIKLIRLDFPAPLIKSIHSFLSHRSFRVLTNSFLRQIVNAACFVRNEIIYRDLKVKLFLPYIKDLSKRFFDNLPNIPNGLIRIQPAYDPAVSSSQKRPRALLDQNFEDFPQAKRIGV